MTLFHSRVIEKHTKHISQIPKMHSDILDSWSKNLVKGVYDSETQNDGEFIQRILVDVLGYTGSSQGENWSVAKNQPVGSGNVDAALGKFSTEKTKIIAPFELKGAKTKDLDAVMSGRNKTPVQQAWEYAMDAKGAQWVLISNYREIRLYAVGYGRKNYEIFKLSKLTEQQEYARFILLLSAENLLSGKTQELLQESEEVDKDITDKLYADYKELRRELIRIIRNDNREKSHLDIIGFAQTILDRILFIAFAEDKGLLPENSLKQAYETQNQYNPQPIWENFQGLFKAINKGNSNLKIPAYNGGLFAENPELDNLKISDELCEGFKKIGDYNFESDVSVNILGHIFEQSISDLEELKANAENIEKTNKGQSKRKKDGIYYTPASITQYIVEKTVGGWLENRKSELGFAKLPILEEQDHNSIKVVARGKRKNQITYNKKIEKHVHFWEKYKKTLSNIKVLDPACGSGAFLNEVFDYLKAEGEAVNNQLSDLKGGQTTVFRWDTHILANNLYGVDLNNESVEITKLSLWLKTASRQEKLTYLEDNIKVGNSLINDSKIAGNMAFDWQEEFPEIISEGGFDVIVGNPPWGAKLSKNEQGFSNSSFYGAGLRNIDSYGLFFGLALSKLKTHGLLGFITPDTFLRKNDLLPVREKLLNEANIIELIETGPLFREVRDTWCAITICKKSSPNKKLKTSHKKIGRFIVSVEERERLFQRREFSETSKINQNVWHKSDDKIIGYIAQSKAQDLIFKIGKCKRFGDHNKLIEISRGEEGSKSKFEKKNQSGFYLVTPEEVIMNHVAAGTQIDKHSVSAGKYNKYYTAPKVWIIRIQKLRWKQRVVSALDDRSNSASTKTLQLIISKEKDLTLLKAIQGVLSSNMINFWCSNYLSDDMNSSYIKKLPIFDVKDQDYETLSKVMDDVIQLKSHFFQIRKVLIDLLSSELSLDKVSRKLKNWTNLEVGEFLSEVEKLIKPEKLSLSQKSEWIQHFETEKLKTLNLSIEISRLKNEAEQIVYKLYNLSEKEIKLIEDYKI